MSRVALLLFVILADLAVIGICLWVIRENRRTLRWLRGEGPEPRSAKTGVKLSPRHRAATEDIRG